MDTGLVAPCERPTAAREGKSLSQRPLPKTVTPLADELLSGWLTRLAVTNHCEVDDLLENIGVDTRQVAMLDFDVEAAATTAEKISIAARVAADTVQSLTFGTMTQTNALMTAQVVSRLFSAWHSAQTVAEVMGIRLPDLRHPTPFDPHQA
jgi:hypothetical protein